jgi:DNA polymerase delta subunit 1
MNKVLSIELISEEFEYVYDLETEDGTYYARSTDSINAILLKNTDSCYVTFDVNKDNYVDENGIFDEISYMKETFRLSDECASRITGTFKKPIDLEFEKVMYPFYIYEKKRYAYQEWTEPEKPHNKLEYKGLSIKRRDSCIYVKETCNTLFELLMKIISDDKRTRGSVEKAFEFARKSIEDLLDNKVPIEKLIISKSLKESYKVSGRDVKWTKPLRIKNGIPEYDPDIYKIPGPHVQLAIRLREKDPINYPKPPERVPYVFIVNKNAKLQHEKVAHPDYLEGLEIDTLYYFEHQLKTPIMQIFDNIIKNTNDLFDDIVLKKINKLNKQTTIDGFFKGATTTVKAPEKNLEGTVTGSSKKDPSKKNNKVPSKKLDQNSINSFFVKKQ